MPQLVFLPGLLCDAELWQQQLTALARPAIVPDLSQHNTIGALAAQVLSEAAPHFALIALSMGGYVAMEIMRQAPERVTRLALFDTSARPDTPEQQARRRALIELAASGKFKGVTPRLLPTLVHPAALHKPAVTEPIIAMAARMGQQGFRTQQQAIIGRVDSRPTLSLIRCPTLIAVGDADQLTPQDLAEEMAALVPQARLAIIPTCGHLPPLEQPAYTTRLLQDWLSDSAA
jgi:pimeloyl-ACP methyl ester carboxylesterase